MEAARHRAFIGTRLLAGSVAIAAMPVYFVVFGAPTPLAGLVLVGLLAPFLSAWYLSRTGAFERAHVLSAASLTAVVAVVAAATGGLGSAIAPWLAAIPLEAALSASRRVVFAGIALAVLAIGGLWGIDSLGWIPPATGAGPTLYMLGALSAALYAGAIALGSAALARRGERLKSAGEARYRLLAQNMTDVITRHGRNGAVMFVSPAAERLAGVPAAGLMGHGLFDRVHVADRPAYLTALADAARGKSASVEYRLRKGPPGRGEDEAPVFIWVETRCRPLGTGDDARGNSEVVAVTRDVSRHKSDAAAVDAARTEAERANAAKSRFLATVSHELRTPLNAIIGFSEMLRNEAEIGLDLARRTEYARLIHESGEHLLAVVNGILDVSRIEAGHFELRREPVALVPLVESCYEMMLLRAEQAGVRYHLEMAPGLPELVADALALRQMLINLISNAIKFTPRGGSVEIAVRAEGDELVFAVTDTGIGIAEADLPQLGDPFFQAGPSYARPFEGTGLGLSVVKGLVELHGGRMEIHSRLGEGTRVMVRLPRAGRPVVRETGRVIERLAQRSAPDRDQKPIHEQVQRLA